MLTIAIGFADVIMHMATMFDCCAITGLVIAPRPSKLGLTYLKTEAS
jgi:hypothetical protein